MIKKKTSDNILSNSSRIITLKYCFHQHSNLDRKFIIKSKQNSDVSIRETLTFLERWKDLFSPTETTTPIISASTSPPQNLPKPKNHPNDQKSIVLEETSSKAKYSFFYSSYLILISKIQIIKPINTPRQSIMDTIMLHLNSPHPITYLEMVYLWRYWSKNSLPVSHRLSTKVFERIAPCELETSNRIGFFFFIISNWLTIK